MRQSLLTVGLVLGLLGAPAARGATGNDPDWPCVQRLVPVLSAGSIWSGPALPADGSWRQEPKVAALVSAIAPRAVPDAEGVRAIEGFAAPLDAEARRRLLPMAVSGTLAETNRTRSGLIESIRGFARRQRGLAETVRQLSEQLDAMDPEAKGEAAARREELQQRLFFATKTFQDAERTMRYMCEAPVRLEARFGAYARAFQAALPEAP
ncbi:hypothetical protein [Teichococcus oryzae]|uniref:Spy/CpxP family protein refolding chaperone n=1 Tax=Teichococcus oryzae TaxID=1608942 RepID=A0A5B2THD3_9PROT|nr:hypothetical protein [Pseudoroseomonas oryzae]KAA2213503.1 hypothetical protein F0Q34_09725 [Pseudoroseomonas oryzae]